MGKFINPFTDLGFKKLFGTEVNKELLIEFLNDLLEGERSVTDVTFLNKEIMPESISGRVVIFDVMCQSVDGTRFIVEMQNQTQDYFFDRGIYYLCRAMGSQGEKGKHWQYEIDPVYGVYFLNFKVEELVKFRTDIILADRETGAVMSNKLRQTYMSLPYFEKGTEECKTNFDIRI